MSWEISPPSHDVDVCFNPAKWLCGTVKPYGLFIFPPCFEELQLYGAATTIWESLDVIVDVVVVAVAAVAAAEEKTRLVHCSCCSSNGQTLALSVEIHAMDARMVKETLHAAAAGAVQPQHHDLSLRPWHAG